MTSEAVDSDALPAGVPARLRTVPRFHQMYTVLRLVDDLRRGMLVAHKPGSGKTLTALLAALRLMQKRQVRRAIILVPLSVVSNWRDTIRKERLEGMDIEVHGHVGWLERFDRGAEAVPPGTLLVVDEAHTFRTPARASKRARAFLRAAAAASRVLLLTGTPVVNRLEDLINLAAAVQGVLPEALPVMFRKGEDALGYLEQHVSYFDRVSGMPAVREHRVQLSMGKAYLAYYNRVEGKAVNLALNGDEDDDAEGYDADELLKMSKNLNVFLNGIRRAANTSGARERTPSPKMAWIESHVPAWVANGERTMLYSGYKDFGVDAATRALAKRGVRDVEVINGDVPERERHEIVRRYNRGVTPVLLVTAAGAEGLDLKRTRHVVIIEPHWNDARMEQAKSRAVRVGSHAGLPSDQQVVDIWSLEVRKPESTEGGEGGLQSADTILQEKCREKTALVVDVAMQRLREAGEVPPEPVSSGSEESSGSDEESLEPAPEEEEFKDEPIVIDGTESDDDVYAQS